MSYPPSTTKNPPAFPQHPHALQDGTLHIDDMRGISLRDYLAAHVVQGILAQAGSQDYSATDPLVVMEAFAITTYRITDALLEVRMRGARPA